MALVALLNHAYTQRYPIPFLKPERRMCGVCHFFTKLVTMATSIDISEKDRSFAPKTLSLGEKIVKIGPADLEIIVLREIIKKDQTRIPSGIWSRLYE